MPTRSHPPASRLVRLPPGPVRGVVATVLAVLALAAGGLVGGSPPVLGASPSAAASEAAGSPPPAPPGPTCPGSLQALIDAAAPGSTVHLDACIYREEIRVDKALTLVGTAGSEIRGSDVWTDWHPAAGGTFESDEQVPQAGGGGTCRPGTDRCHRADQVFVDGRPLDGVSSSPRVGQFAVGDDRRVILGADPSGHLVEVSVRPRWIDVTATGVTVKDVTFRDAANDPQAEQAALRVTTADRFSLVGSHLFAAHGALLGVVGGSGHRITDSELAGAGQEGFALAGVSDTEVSRNAIHDNNTDGFDPEWEAGAGKAGRARGLTFRDNIVSRNAGPGLWCDLDCRNVEFSGNRVDHNEREGIFYEISTDGRILDNVVLENGWGRPDWAWGAGILVSSSGGVTVDGNVVAWNADGIGIVSQDRPDRPRTAGTGITVTDNVVALSPQPGDNADVFLLAWLQDWPGALYDAGSDNHGSDNRFWDSRAEPSGDRFHWADGDSRLTDFAATPGGVGSTYIDAVTLDSVLSGREVPDAGEQHEVPAQPVRLRSLVVPIAIAGAAIAILVLLVIGLFWRRRRRAPREA